MLKIEYMENLDKEVGDILGAEFEKNANENDLECNYSSYSFVAKENGEVLGIISGQAIYDEVKIEELIVCKQHRDKHIGSMLIQAVENHYKSNGQAFMSVSTHDFQAPNFYKKKGFKVEFVRENEKTPKLNKYFLIKHF